MLYVSCSMPHTLSYVLSATVNSLFQMKLCVHTQWQMRRMTAGTCLVYLNASLPDASKGTPFPIL